MRGGCSPLSTQLLPTAVPGSARRGGLEITRSFTRLASPGGIVHVDPYRGSKTSYNLTVEPRSINSAASR